MRHWDPGAVALNGYREPGGFTGEWCHSTQSKHGIEFKRKRIFWDPLIEIVQFIRSPPWHIDKVKVVFSGFAKWIFAHVPEVMHMYRNHIFLQPSVSIGFGRAARITNGRVETVQDAFTEEIPADFIIFTTGFTVEEYPFHVSGIDGRTIQGYYKEHGGPTAYLDTAVPGLPSFCMVSSALFLHRILKSQSENTIQRRLEGSVLMQRVSWHRAGGAGKVTSVFSGPPTLFWWWMRRPVWGDYEVVGGERWRKVTRARKVTRVVGIAPLVVASVRLRRNWEAVESGARNVWYILNGRPIFDIVSSRMDAVGERAGMKGDDITTDPGPVI
ncbi:hypothetical protein FIBSPDRAFT_957346 [Athelia psychrophila]|uniref:FAD/NAD(P)-binding domain-containing protein n=1 Tax=Athelia psychrophila TaxID=1759441 RepID=A0A166FU92_9AGAM|nr:hypothetical protein FIBSPDRAFT_957346 [Fibularhizoctonia sp. CBS 109695]